MDTAKKKLNIKAIIIPVVAVVVVVAIVLGIALSSTSKPAAAFNALRKTVFESATLSVTVTAEDNEIGAADLEFGNGLNDSVLDVKLEGREISLDKGDLVLDGQNLGSIDAIIERLQQMGLEGYGVETSDLDIIEILDSLINGKLDEDAFADFYDNEFAPNLEKSIENANDISIELPTYDQTMDIIERFLKNYLTEEAVSFEKIKSEEKGMTYEYTIYMDEFAECVGEFVKKDKEVRAMLEDALAEADSPYESVDEFADDLVEEYSDSDEKIEGEVTVASGRITRVLVDIYGDEMEIRIESAK